MFSLEFSDEQQMLRDLAHEFAVNEMRPVAAHYDQSMEFPWPVIRKAHELGLMNTHVPEEYGGLGLGCLDECLLVEDLVVGARGEPAGHDFFELFLCVGDSPPVPPRV